MFSFLFNCEKTRVNGFKYKKYFFLGKNFITIKKKVADYSQILGVLRYKYVHILHKTLITVNIVKLLNRYFNQSEHAFIFNSGAAEKVGGRLFGHNIFYGNIMTLKLDLQITEKVIVYGLFSPRLSKYLYNNAGVLARTYWAIMGGDLYSAPDNEIENFVRQNVAGIITTFDKNEYYQRFGNKKTYDIVYNNPIVRYIRKPVKHKSGKPYRIMINNSTDETTLEMLDFLAKYKDENIIVTTNLSYKTYGQTDVKNRILKKGREIFGTKFDPVLKWKQPRQYIRFLSSVDVYISNQNRQQGVGNISALMLLGKKIFVKSSTTTYSGFTQMGIKVFDTATIKRLPFEEFIQESKADVERNIQILNKRFSYTYQMNLWENVFHG
ncbi:MAG: TDP-N-acetylfucosamine:lipid II N-acetylfucosaminyltransferase [Proteobacteria bacterium]|nr:TDP-N-acetylfucosamine:lipid II N-acetylfucosaminyltransferase [Pseudomonadota bacterium]